MPISRADLGPTIDRAPKSTKKVKPNYKAPTKRKPMKPSQRGR